MDQLKGSSGAVMKELKQTKYMLEDRAGGNTVTKLGFTRREG
jgi:hypothetical protein